MNILSEEKIFSQEELQEQKISSVSMGMLRAFDVLLKFFRKGSQENFRSYKVTIPVTGYLDVEVGANTMQIVVANTTTGYLDSTKIRLGELAFTYPTAEVQLDNFLLPKIGMGFRIYGSASDEYMIIESIHTNRLINNDLLNGSVTTERLTAYKKIVLLDSIANPVTILPGGSFTSAMFDATGYDIGLVYFSNINNSGLTNAFNVQTIFHFGQDFQDGTDNTFTTYLNNGGVNNGSTQNAQVNYNYGGYRTALIGNTSIQISNPSSNANSMTVGYLAVRLVQGVNS